jgi:DNA-binding XRE family transcriptional regulator
MYHHLAILGVSLRPIGGTLQPSARLGTIFMADTARQRKGGNVATVLVKNANRMMTSATPTEEGLAVTFADGYKGLVPFADLPEIGTAANLKDVELPNPYEITLQTHQGETVTLPWDFIRHYCDASYRPRMEAIAASGRKALGNRVRQLREAAGLTQEELVARAGIGRITLIRIEQGEQSPRYETLMRIAQALGLRIGELLSEGPGAAT